MPGEVNEHGAAYANFVARIQRLGSDGSAVDKRAVPAVQVFQLAAIAGPGENAMLARDGVIVEMEIIDGLTPHRIITLGQRERGPFVWPSNADNSWLGSLHLCP